MELSLNVGYFGPHIANNHEYIKELVEKNPELCNYDLLNNKGYGTKSHINAIKEYGKTEYHRKSFKIFS